MSQHNWLRTSAEQQLCQHTQRLYSVIYLFQEQIQQLLVVHLWGYIYMYIMHVKLLYMNTNLDPMPVPSLLPLKYTPTFQIRGIEMHE